MVAFTRDSDDKGKRDGAHRPLTGRERRRADRERHNRRRAVSTAALVVLFLALAVLYGYLHGSTRFELFNPPAPTTESTVQPVPVMPWEDYQKSYGKKNESEQTESSGPASEAPSEPQDSDPIKRLPEILPKEPAPSEGDSEKGATPNAFKPAALVMNPQQYSHRLGAAHSPTSTNTIE